MGKVEIHYSLNLWIFIPKPIRIATYHTFMHVKTEIEKYVF